MYTQELRKQIIDLRKQNKTIKEISTITRKGEIALRNYLSRYKIFKTDERTPLLNNLTNLELAYIAGIIDGEGSIIISRLKENKGTHKYRYQLFVKVVNTDERLLKFLSKKTLTNYYKDKDHPNKSNSRTSYSIHWSVSVSEDLLKKVYPFLIIKKEQVDLALKFRKTFDISYGNKVTPLEIMEQRQKYYLEMKRLHKEFK